MQEGNGPSNGEKKGHFFNEKGLILRIDFAI
jgi:hypothetical protein